MQKIIELLKRHKQTIAIAIIAALSVYNLWAGQQPAPSVVTFETLARPTVIVPTVTPKPARVTATPTKVVTNTPIPSATSTGVATVTSTPLAGVCPQHPNAWHAPLDEVCYHHHHGDNPRQYASVFSDGGFDLDKWLEANGELYQTAWLSSASEDIRGMIWLYVHTDKCELFNNGGELDTASFGCITDVLFRVHDVGTAEHMVNRFHSYSIIIRACNQLPNEQPGTQCGILATGGLADYGILETPYKNAHCPLANDPPGFSDLNQPAYRANQTEDRGDLVQYWAGLHPNAIQAAYYPHDPNALVGVAWSSTDTYQVWDYATGCNQLTVDAAKLAAQKMPYTSYDHSNFSIFEIIVYSVPVSPFIGFVDQWGHVMPTGECEEVSNTCIPLEVTGAFPEKALYNRVVDNRIPGLNEYADPLLLPPWLDVP